MTEKKFSTPLDLSKVAGRTLQGSLIGPFEGRWSDPFRVTFQNAPGSFAGNSSQKSTPFHVLMTVSGLNFKLSNFSKFSNFSNAVAAGGTVRGFYCANAGARGTVANQNRRRFRIFFFFRLQKGIYGNTFYLAIKSVFYRRFRIFRNRQ